MVAPHINTVAKTYELAAQPEHREVMTTISHLTGERIHRYTHIFQSPDDLVKKIQMLRLLGQTTGTCFQRCVGLDALNAVFAASYEIDLAEGTDYHERFKRYLEWVQKQDLMLAGAMTDSKGQRTVRPSGQKDPDSFVHVVDHRVRVDVEDPLVRVAKLQLEIRQAVVDLVDPLDVRAESCSAAEVQGQVYAQPCRLGHGIDQGTERRLALEREVVPFCKKDGRNTVFS